MAGATKRLTEKAASCVPSTRRKPSINYVARLAGVSYQTVSRVINDAPDVSEVTRQRVLKVIQEVGYRRSRTAAALVISRSTAIGILTDGPPFR